MDVALVALVILVESAQVVLLALIAAKFARPMDRVPDELASVGDAVERVADAQEAVRPR